MNARTWLFTGIAFVVGLVLAGAIFYSGSPLSSVGSGPAAPIIARITNTGTHELTFQADLTRADGTEVQRGQGGIGPGVRHDEPFEAAGGQLIVRLHAGWVSSTSNSAGDASSLGNTADCGASQSLVFRFDVDTTNGIAFPVVKTFCE